jgi:hypothetical protein
MADDYENHHVNHGDKFTPIEQTELSRLPIHFTCIAAAPALDFAPRHINKYLFIARQGTRI